MTPTATVLSLLGIWVLWIISIAGIGVFITSYIPGLRARGGAARWRSGLWWGLFVVTIAFLSGSLLTGLAQPAGRVMTALLLLGGLALFLWFVIRDASWVFPKMRWSLTAGAVILILSALAGWALAEPGNYDTGLYHLGAISYSAEFPVIPGLANVHDRFGFNSTMWPVSAGMGSLGMEADAFRILNGVLVGLALTDLGLRLASSRCAVRVRPGTGILLFGLTLILGAIAQYPARLIASPAQDTAALVLVVVATAYLADTVRSGGASIAAARVAIVTSVMAGMMRPLGWIFAGAVVVVTCSLVIRFFGLRRSIRLFSGTGLLTALALTLMMLRDAVLSGWIFFPLKLVPVAVDWRLPDPSRTSRDIQGWARTPFQPVEETLASNSWVAGWLTRLPTDWSIPALGLLLVVALLVWVRWHPGPPEWVRMATLTCLPAGLTLMGWLYSAPDPRFAWGYIVTCGLVPLAFLTERFSRLTLVVASGTFLVALLVLAGLRGSFGVWTWSAVKPPSSEVFVGTLSDGTVTQIPSAGDQCWSVYPLCRPDYAPDSIELRGSGLRDGFRPVINAE